MRAPGNVGLAHRRNGSLRGAKAAVGVDRLARAVEVDLHVETVLATAWAKAIIGWDLDRIHAGTKAIIAHIASDVAAFANDDIGFTFALPIETNGHLPDANALAFDHRATRHIAIVAVPTVAA